MSFFFFPFEVTLLRLACRKNYIQKIIDKDGLDLPMYLHYESVSTKFVHVNLFISTASIPVKLRPLISVFWEMFFATPVMIDGVRVEYEKVVELLEKDTINTAITSGTYVDLPESVRIRLQVEMGKYETAIRWLRTLLWDSIFDKKRIGITISKLRSDIPDEKRQGKSVRALGLDRYFYYLLLTKVDGSCGEEYG